MDCGDLVVTAHNEAKVCRERAKRLEKDAQAWTTLSRRWTLIGDVTNILTLSSYFVGVMSYPRARFPTCNLLAIVLSSATNLVALHQTGHCREMFFKHQSNSESFTFLSRRLNDFAHRDIHIFTSRNNANMSLESMLRQKDDLMFQSGMLPKAKTEKRLWGSQIEDYFLFQDSPY